MIFFSSESSKLLHYCSNYLNVGSFTARPDSVAAVELTDADLLQAALNQSRMHFRGFQPVGDAHAKLSDLQRANGEVWVHVAHSRDFMYAIEVVEAGDSRLDPPLHAAVKEGNLDRVRLYLDSKHAIQMSVLNGDTPLMLAIRGGHTAIAHELLRAGADSNAVHDRGLTPVMQAAEMGNGTLIRMLVAHGANVNAVDASWMPALIFAARHGHLDAVNALLAAKANVNATVRPIDVCRGYSALLLAAKNGHVDAVNALLEAKADNNAVDTRGNTSLMLAVESKHVQVVNALLAAGADIDARNEHRFTALMMAARSGQVEIVKELLGAHARVDIVDIGAQTALTHTRHPEIRALLKEAQQELQSRIGNGSLAEMAIRLVDANGGADALDAWLPPVNGSGAAAASGLAAASGATPLHPMLIVDYLLNHMQPVHGTKAAAYNSDVTSAIKRGDTVFLETMLRFGTLFINDYLLTAIRDGDAAGVDTLLRAGADANFKFAFQTTPLMIATHLGQSDIVKTLLAAGANIDAVSSGGHAALLYAVHAGNTQVVEILINAQAGIDIERGNKTGLMVSVPGDHEAMARKLLQAKVDTVSLNEAWKTAQEHAHEHGQAEIAKMLAVAREKIGFPVADSVGLQAPASGSGAASAEQTQPASAEQLPAAAAFSASLASVEVQPMDSSFHGIGAFAHAMGHAETAGFLDAASTRAFDGGHSHPWLQPSPFPSALGHLGGAAQADAMDDVPDVLERDAFASAHQVHPSHDAEHLHLHFALPPFAFGPGTLV